MTPDVKNNILEIVQNAWYIVLETVDSVEEREKMRKELAEILGVQPGPTNEEQK